MAIAISDAHRELGAVARAFLESEQGARRGACAARRARRGAARRSGTSSRSSAGSVCTSPRRSAGRATACPSSSSCSRSSAAPRRRGRSSPTVMASTLIATRGRRRAAGARFLPALVDGSQAGAVGLGGSLRLDARRRPRRVTPASCSAPGSPTCSCSARATTWSSSIATPPASRSSVQPGLDPTRRVGRVTLDGRPRSDTERVLARRGRRSRSDLAWLLAAAEAAGGAQECVERGDRVREGPPAVRPADRDVPGGEAPLRQHARRRRARDRRGVGRGARRRAGRRPVRARRRGRRHARAPRLLAQRAAQHPGARRHRVHVGARRPPAAAPRRRARRAVRRATPRPRRCTGLAAGGSRRELGFDLPPEAEEFRDATRAVAEELAALDGDAQRARLIDTGYVQPHWPKPWGREAKALEQLVIDEEFAAPGVQRPQYGITGWIILTLIQHAHRRPDRAVGAADARARARVVPALQRARRRLRRRRRPHRGDARRRWLGDHRPEGVDERRAVLPPRPRHRAHQSRRRRSTTASPRSSIDMHAEGVEVRPLREATGASMFNEVFFDDVFVPDDDVVGPVDDGWTVAASTLGNERVSIGGGGGGGFGRRRRPTCCEHGTGRRRRRDARSGEHVAEGADDARAQPAARSSARSPAASPGPRATSPSCSARSTHSGRPTSRLQLRRARRRGARRRRRRDRRAAR